MALPSPVFKGRREEEDEEEDEEEEEKLVSSDSEHCQHSVLQMVSRVELGMSSASPVRHQLRRELLHEISTRTA